MSNAKDSIHVPVYNAAEGEMISLDQFDRLLQKKSEYDALVRSAAEEGKGDDYRAMLAEMKHGLISECVNQYISNLRQESASEGFHHLTDTWGFEDTVCMIAENYWMKRAVVAQKMAEVDSFAGSGKRHTEKKRRTIAAYYRNIKNGGAQRVVASLCNTWQHILDENGEPLYRIVLITDEEKLEDEYDLDENIVRCYLPAHDIYTKGAYRERLRAWDRILSEQDVDIVVDSMWMSPCTLYDMLCVKNHKNHPLFLIHAHNFCAVLYQNEGSSALAQLSIYQMCDGVVTLSECDRDFVGAFCSYVKCIPNPIEIRRPDITCHKEGNVLVWVGRLSSEKKPLDVIYAMEYLVRECPDAVLYIVGDGDETIRMQMENTIRELHLTEHIIMTGFQLNVDEYYKKASVFLGTSEYEGFSLVISEAMSYAIPVVSYDLPWLTFMRDGRGVVSVKQGRPDLLAKEAAVLLHNPGKAFMIGQEGKKQIEELAQTDLGKEWKEFFEGAGSEPRSPENDSSEAILFQYLTFFQQKGKDKIRLSVNQKNNKEKTELKKENGKLKKDQEKLEKKLDKISQEEENLKDRLQKAAQEKTELKDKLQKTKQEKSELKDSLQKIKQEKVELKDRLEEMKQEKTELKDQIQKTKQEKEDSDKEIKKLKESRDYRIGHRLLWLPRKIKQFYREYREVLLYLVFGAGTSVISIITYTIANVTFHINELIANIISWILAVTFAFFTNRTWVFQSRTHSAKEFFEQLTGFFGGRVATLVVEEAIIFIFITLLQLNSIAVKLVAQVVVIVLNYIISKLWVFKK